MCYGSCVKLNGEKMYNIGFTCGVFDLCHAGHMLMFREAKSICDHLIVGIQIDPHGLRPGKNKPVQTITERMIQVAACKYVDEVIVYATEDDLRDILISFQIDVRILSEEYQNTEYTGFNINSHDVYFNKRQHKYSTSELRNRISST